MKKDKLYGNRSTQFLFYNFCRFVGGDVVVTVARALASRASYSLDEIPMVCRLYACSGCAMLLAAVVKRSMRTDTSAANHLVTSIVAGSP